MKSSYHLTLFNRNRPVGQLKRLTLISIVCFALLHIGRQTIFCDEEYDSADIANSQEPEQTSSSQCTNDSDDQTQKVECLSHNECIQQLGTPLSLCSRDSIEGACCRLPTSSSSSLNAKKSKASSGEPGTLSETCSNENNPTEQPDICMTHKECMRKNGFPQSLCAQGTCCRLEVQSKSGEPPAAADPLAMPSLSQFTKPGVSSAEAQRQFQLAKAAVLEAREMERHKRIIEGLIRASRVSPRPTRAPTPRPQGVFGSPLDNVDCGRNHLQEIHDQSGASSPQSARLSNGQETKFGQHPWMVSMLTTKPGEYETIFHFCGAAMISRYWAITAAHCLNFEEKNSPLRGLNITNIMLRFGEHDFSGQMEPCPSEHRRIKNFFIHPAFDSKSLANDIALLKFAKPMESSDHIAPVCVTPKEMNLSGRTAIVTGWGVSHEGDFSTPGVLKHIRVPIMKNPDCQRKYRVELKMNVTVSDGIICGQPSDDGQDACQGDSGGPLVVNERDRHYLIGVVSSGYGCAKKNHPGFYTRVATFRDWIDTTIRKN